MRLRIREICFNRDIKLIELYNEVVKHKKVSMITLRRCWYSTKDGTRRGDPIELVDLTLLKVIATILEVRLIDLINEEEL